MKDDELKSALLKAIDACAEADLIDEALYDEFMDLFMAVGPSEIGDDDD